ncbi:MAG TPA: hypothetical protein H9772_10475, partial [Candidatus Oscillibacter pullicola]|nr:hypothetical protein [Candidatus Oscillibacter pullicola]
TLFNLQGARRSRRNIAIIQDFIPFVKNFFQKFFGIRSIPYVRQLFKFTTSQLRCQELFSFLPGAAHHRADSFVRIPNPSPFVNTLFRDFSFF